MGAGRQRGALVVLMAGWSACASSLASAPVAGALPSDISAIVRSFAALARARPTFCKEQAGAAPDNWIAAPAQCAWRGALTMQRWVPGTEGGSSCVSMPALWWHWRRAMLPVESRPPLWNQGWRRQAIIQGAEQAGKRRISLLTQDVNGIWVATEWQWSPPRRGATQAWELRRWKQLERAVGDLNDAAAPSVNAALHDIWQRNLRGRRAEIAGATMVWEAGRQCLRLKAADQHDDPAIPLPYAREDSRLEQRAATQVQLARSAPGTSWPVPFHLMLPSFAQQRSATYAAIGRRNGLLTGRLWLPARDEPAVLRARVETTLTFRPGTPEEARVVTALDRELEALAAQWTAEHEH